MRRRRATVATPVNGNVKLGRAAARSGEWAQHFQMLLVNAIGPVYDFTNRFK